LAKLGIKDELSAILTEMIEDDILEKEENQATMYKLKD
jgi:hypothetical protein